MPKDVGVIIKRKNLLWRVYIVGNNGENMLTSETYYSKSNATRAAIRISKALGIPINPKKTAL